MNLEKLNVGVKTAAIVVATLLGLLLGGYKMYADLDKQILANRIILKDVAKDIKELKDVDQRLVRLETIHKLDGDI